MTTLGTEVKRNSKTRWKKIGVLVLIISLLGSIIAFPHNTKADDGLSLFYTVTVEKDKPTFHVNIEINGVKKGYFYFGFTDSTTTNPQDYIKNLQVKQMKTLLRIETVGNYTWRVYVQKENAVIDYDVNKIVPVNKFNVPSSQKLANVYIDDNCGMINARVAFMIPSYSFKCRVSDIKIKFNLPSPDWKIVCPYVQIDTNTYQVPRITNYLRIDFVNRRGIYFGKMKFYSEEKTGNCIVKYGILKADQRQYTKRFIHTQKDLDFNVHLIAEAVDTLTKLFWENPYPVLPISDCITINGWNYASGAGVIGGNQFWPPGRYDETVGHLFYCWMYKTGLAPTGTDNLICKGMGEFYVGNKIAYRITGNKHYLGKIYADYLVYKGALGTKYFDREEIKDAYYKGAVLGIYLDKLIQKETNKTKSLENAFGYLYKKYKNTDIQITNTQLEEAVNAVTGQNNSEVFKKYVNGNEEIPVQDYIQPYKDAFPKFIEVLDSPNWGVDFHGYTIPFFINVEIATRLSLDLPFSILIIDHYNDFAKYVLENYNVNKLTKQDVINTLNKITNTNDNSNFFEQWKDSYGELSLDEMKEWLKSYLPYSPKNLNASFKGNAVVLNWDQVGWRYTNDYYRIIGYDIYRGTSSGKENKIATVDSNSYTDTNIESGKTYYYYVESLEDQPFGDGVHTSSEPSKEIKVTCKDTTPPTLSITSPENYTTVNEDTVSVSGTVTDNESGMDTVTVNGNNVSISTDGSFNTAVTLTEGTNTITVIATDKAGNKVSKTITVTYEKPVQTITITLQPDNPYMTVNGVQKEIDPGRGTKPVIIKEWSRTVVPIRAIVEALGGTISWDGVARKVTIKLKGKIIELWIDNPKAKVNDETKWIDPNNHNVKPIIINQRTMLPLRFVAESLGCTVDWNPDTKTITITYKG